MKLFKNQRGLAHLAVVLIVVVCLAAVGGIVYYALNRSGSSILPTKFNDQCEYNDKELCKFLNNTKNLKSFKVESVDTAKDGTKSNSTYEADGTEKLHLVSYQNGQETYNFISIDNTTYTKDYSDGKWYKQTTEPSQEESVKEDYSLSGDEVNPSKTTYKALGKEACGSRQCFKYQVIEQANTDMTQFIWFDDKDYLLRKTTLETDASKSEMTYSYDKVSISEPSPVKDTPPASGGVNLPNPPTDSGNVDSAPPAGTMTEVPYGDE